MVSLRHHILGHRALAALLLTAALLMKLLVPAGFMPAVSAGRFAIVLCPGDAPAPMTAPMAAAMPGMHHTPPDGSHHGKAESPCPYASLTTPGLAGADPVQLALALLFIAAAAVLAAPRLRLVRLDHLRPPLRGPPRTA